MRIFTPVHGTIQKVYSHTGKTLCFIIRNLSIPIHLLIKTMVFRQSSSYDGSKNLVLKVNNHVTNSKNIYNVRPTKTKPLVSKPGFQTQDPTTAQLYTMSDNSGSVH